MKGRKFFPLLLVVAGLLAYQNSFTGSYYHDDFGSIPENPTIRQLWPLWQPLWPPQRGGLTVESRPLINLSLAVNYALGGYNVWGYHALNLTVHILAGLTLLGIVRRTLLAPTLVSRFGAVADELAVAIAVLWTVHPLQTESVTYIVQRAESIMGLFYLLTLYCFIRGVDSQRARLWYGLSVAACVLGMLSKEVMVTAPVMVMLYDRVFLSGSIREAWRRRWRLYLALGSTWVPLGFLLVSRQVPTTLTNAQHIGLRWWQYLATEPGVILYYLRLTAWPHPLRFDSYGWPIAKTWMSILPPAAAVVILLGATVWAWRKNPAWGFVGAWFFLILAPTSSVIPLVTPIYEHRMYLSLAALVSVVVMGLYSVAGRRSLAVLAAVAIGLGFLTWWRNQDYRRNPHYSLAFALARAGRHQEAIDQYEQALRITPDDAAAHYNLGISLKELGRPQEAIAHYERALQIKPDFPDALYNLANTLSKMGRLDEATGRYEQALRFRPGDPDTHYNLGLALVRQGKMTEAIEHYVQAVHFRPDSAEAYNGLGIALAQVGRVQEAIGRYEEAVRIKPDYVEAHNNWGLVLVGLGRTQEAIGHWEQALRIQPDYAEAHNNLGSALAQLGRVREAVEHWEQALRINPNHPEAHYNLGVALEHAGRTTEAINHYEQVLQIKPDHVAAQERLARLRAVQ